MRRFAPRGIGMALPTALVLSAILGIAAVCGHSAACAQRRQLDHALARRALIAAARSAFEEAASRLEVGNADLVPLSLDTLQQSPRDLGPMLSIPPQVEPTVTQNELRRLGIQVGPVRLRSSSWSIISRPADGGGMQVLEAGVLELAVEVSIGDSRPTVVTARRHMDASPEEGHLRLHVSAADMLLTARSS